MNFSEDSFLYPIVLIVTALGLATIIAALLRLVFKGIVKRSIAKRGSPPPTYYFFIKNAIGFLVYGIAIFVIFYKIEFLKHFAAPLFASAGIIAAIIAFAAQKAFANVIGGLFILIFKPFEVGNDIEVGGNRGLVESVTLRHTVIKDYENKRVIIPNSVISSETIINSSFADERIRQHFEVPVTYNTDLDKAIRILQQAVESHELLLDGRSKEEKESGIHKVQVKVVRLADSGVVLRAWIWTMNIREALKLKWDVYKIVIQKFREEGIEVPYPHRTIVYKQSGSEENFS